MRCNVIDKRIMCPIVGNRTPVRQVTQCHELTKLQKLVTYVTQLVYSSDCVIVNWIEVLFYTTIKFEMKNFTIHMNFSENTIVPEVGMEWDQQLLRTQLAFSCSLRVNRLFYAYVALYVVHVVL